MSDIKISIIMPVYKVEEYVGKAIESISHRLRKYTIAANNSLTIPAFFENRFQDKKRILLLLSSIVIVIFFRLYSFIASLI